jgi:exodeoxyribonuclease VII large subunit
MIKNIFTVGQVNNYIKNMFAQDYMLRQIYVKGELSNLKYHTSGHIYFTLKDATSAIKGIMFSSSARNLKVKLHDGDQVTVKGQIGTYVRDGVYQIYASEIVPEGNGDLYRQFEQIKKELEEMGMFSPQYKKPIPNYARTVGIVTAPTGAAVRDIINIAGRRNPTVQLYLYPALVQGTGAVDSIIEGIRMLDAFGVDVMIVGRGGGSIEDLWAFNDPKVAQAIFACETPVISAVGHETDTTIADYVADLRAPTPSAAAELAVFEQQAAREQLRQMESLLERQMGRVILANRQRVERDIQRLKLASPEAKLREQKMYLLRLFERLETDMANRMQRVKNRLSYDMESLEARSPLSSLKRGYSYTTDEEDHMVRCVSQLKRGERLKIRMMDGQAVAVVEELIADTTVAQCEGTKNRQE